MRVFIISLVMLLSVTAFTQGVGRTVTDIITIKDRAYTINKHPNSSTICYLEYICKEDQPCITESYYYSIEDMLIFRVVELYHASYLAIALNFMNDKYEIKPYLVWIDHEGDNEVTLRINESVDLFTVSYVYK